MTLKELMEKRANLVAQARELVDRADTEKRDLNAEEQQTYAKIMADVNSIKGQVTRAQQIEDEERALNDPAFQAHRPNVGETGDQNRASDEERASAWRSYLGRGPQGLTQVEARALQADLDASGGYLVAPTEWRNQLIKGLDNLVFVRRLAAVQPAMPNATSLGVPTLETDIGDPTWTTELQVGGEDSALAFGKRELTPHPLARYIKISNKLRRAAMQNIDAIVRERLVYKTATVTEYAYLRGTGAGQPLGMMVASADGINTDRDVSTGNTTTAITADGLLAAFYALKPQYRTSAVWMFHTDALLAISKIKDGVNQYVWQPGIAAGAPDVIKGRPVYESQYMPNTFTAGQYVGLLGDLKAGYWIVDSLQLEIQVLSELYAMTNQTAFVMRMETDGMPVLPEAFVRVQLAAS
ncbi:MAG: major capsid protein [Phage 5P_3]|nr:MAG: major capsid protein [Phage 5P_3]